MSPLTRGWVVTFSGLGINLALGVLYTWSVFAKDLTRPLADGGVHEWTAAQAGWPYAVAVACFAITMVFAGRLQDRVGPRWVATAGGVLVGLGMLVASLSPVRLVSAGAFPGLMTLGFGLLTGVGIGLAYASTTPAAVKWFSASRKGLVAGIVVSGFGLAALYTTPLTTALIRTYGVNESFLFLGVVYFVVIVGLAQFLTDPPKGYVPPGSYAETPTTVGPRPATHEYTWREMLGTRSFVLLWLMYACVTAAGLAVIGILSRVVAGDVSGGSASAGYELAAALALGSGIGRPLAGAISDRIGRQHTLLGVFALQALCVLSLNFAGTGGALPALSFVIGVNYGANLALFPATTFDFFGTRYAGVDYGLVFTGWGVGGLVGAWIASWAFAKSPAGYAPGGAFTMAFGLAAALCIIAVGMTFALRAPDPHPEHCPVISDESASRA